MVEPGSFVLSTYSWLRLYHASACAPGLGQYWSSGGAVSLSHHIFCKPTAAGPKAPAFSQPRPQPFEHTAWQGSPAMSLVTGCKAFVLGWRPAAYRPPMVTLAVLLATACWPLALHNGFALAAGQFLCNLSPLSKACRQPVRRQ